MSEENVRCLLRALELWNEGDLGPRWRELYDPEVEVIAIEGWPEGSVEPGIEAWRRQAQRLREGWEKARVEVDEIRSIGEDRVFAQIRYVTEGSDSGISFDTPMAVLAFLKRGRITRMQFHWDVADALEAAGSA
jgi:ketosteroid isomerase-like protein